MYKLKVSISLFLLVVTLFCAAQNSELDSLLQVSKSKSGADKIAWLNRTASQLIEENPDLALAISEFTLKKVVTGDESINIAGIHLIQGKVYRKKYDHEAALKSFFNALEIFDKNKDPKGRMRSLLLVGQVYLDNQDFNQAEDNFVKTLHIAERLKDKQAGAEAHQSLGEVYLEQRIFGKSIEHFQASLELWMEQEAYLPASKIATRLGQISMDLGNHEQAIHAFQTSLHLYQELRDAPQIAAMKTAIGQAYLGQDMPNDALSFSEESYRLREKLQDSLGMAECLKDMGLAKLKLQSTAAARADFEQSITLIKALSPSPKTPQILQEISTAYATMGEPAMAYQTHLAYSRSRDENFNQEKSRALLEMQTRYETAFEAQRRQAEIELLQVENSNSRKINYFLFAMLGLIGMLLANLFLSFRRKQKDNRLLQRKNEEIIRQKNEIDLQNQELETKNISLDLLNKKLVDEISERENIEKSSFARDRFLATMSHEMRTPLNVIIGLTHILIDANPRADQVEHLRTLQFSANDLVVFINDVLDFSKIEAGKLNLEDRPFEPQKIFTDLKFRFESEAEEKGILFNFFQEQMLPQKLFGDDVRFMQIMSNLLIDTFQHTEEGYVKVEVGLQELKSKDALLRIIVEGSDGGLNRTLIEDNESFFFNEEDEHTAYQGQHFSLSITKRLVELQNGKMTIEVEKGVGTKFTVVLPFKVAADGNENVVNNTGKEKIDLNGRRILVVEDNKINQLVVSKMLVKNGAEVVAASNGLEALEVFDHQSFDLVLMDIQMPVMDGYRATAEIRRHPEEDKNSIPIIALTASAFLTEKEKAVLFGMNDHVAKPFSPDELLDKIQSCLSTYNEA